MQLLRKLVWAAIAGGFLAGGSAGAAFADPIGGQLAVPLTLTCGESVLTVVSPNEPAATLQVIGTTYVLVATEATRIITYVDPQTGLPVTETLHVVFGAGNEQATGLQPKLTTCTSNGTVQDPNLGDVTYTITVTLATTPLS
jgi:hypothetical protein